MFTPHTPLLYGKIGVYRSILILFQNIDCGYSLEPPRGGSSSNGYPQSMLKLLKAIHFSWLGPELLVCCLAHRGPTGVFLLLRS